MCLHLQEAEDCMKLIRCRSVSRNNDVTYNDASRSYLKIFRVWRHANMFNDNKNENNKGVVTPLILFNGRLPVFIVDCDRRAHRYVRLYVRLSVQRCSALLHTGGAMLCCGGKPVTRYAFVPLGFVITRPVYPPHT